MLSAKNSLQYNNIGISNISKIERKDKNTYQENNYWKTKVAILTSGTMLTKETSEQRLPKRHIT